MEIIEKSKTHIRKQPIIINNQNSKLMKISITRALSELKLLQKRYDKEVSQLEAIAVQHGHSLVKNSSVKPEDFEKNAKAQLQSIKALQERILNIKTKIQQSNAVTMVKIGSKEMTVLEAIVRKSLLDNEKTLLKRLQRQLVAANDNFELATSQNEGKVIKQLEDATKASTTKLDLEIEKQIKASVDSLYPIRMVDPCEISKVIKDLEMSIEDFEANVDFALSESNSLTQIEVED